MLSPKVKKFTFKFLIIALAFGISFVYSRVNYIAGSSSNLRVKVYDVGQGDSIFISKGDVAKVLIDGGPDSKVVGLLVSDLPPGPCELDIVVLTHPHADHLAGLNSVLKYCRVDLVLETAKKASSKVFSNWERELYEGTMSGRIKKVREVKAGESFSIADITFDVLWPSDNKYIESVANDNMASMVLLLTYKDFTALLTGDAEKGVYDSASFSSLPHVTFFKVPHHGSANALNPDFLKKISPSVSVISVGKNNTYQLPSPKTISYLESISSDVYRTDQVGSVFVETTGVGYRVTREK